MSNSRPILSSAIAARTIPHIHLKAAVEQLDAAIVATPPRGWQHNPV